MKRVWLIYNLASGSVERGSVDAIDAAFGAVGWTYAGRSAFPDDALPEIAHLEDCDMVVVAAGDGTINAVARALDDWPGMLLVLPGGTMNMLPKALHGDNKTEAIIAAAANGAPAAAMPTVVSGEHRALVAALVGPAASWVHAREAIRKGRWHRAARAAQLGWTRSFGRSVRTLENGRRSVGYRAVSLAPEAGHLRIVSVTARGWRDAAQLGWHWLAGDIEAAPGVTTGRADTLQLAASRPVFALFDGEPAHLPPDAVLSPSSTRLRFVRTL